MELQPLYAIQKNVDHVIAENLGIDIHSIENVDKRVHAFKVEVSEFSNETGWFKYWKQSHKMNRSRTLEELADCMAFLLSVGISRNYTFVKTLHPFVWKKVPLGTLFRYLDKTDLDSSGKWKAAFEHLISIGLKLGFSVAEMEVMYYTKSGINIERQMNNY